MQIFFSHNTQDKEAVEAIASWFTKKGYNVWLDNWRMAPGDSLIGKIGEGIEGSDKLVVFLSPDSVDSNWVKKEVATGLVLELAEDKGLGEKFVIPAVLKKCKVPIMLRDKLYADFTNKPFEAACQQLLHGIDDTSPGPLDKKLENRQVRYWHINGLGRGAYGLVVEFSVKTSPTVGVHVGIDTGSKYFEQKEWFGIPNNPVVPQNVGSAYTMSSVRNDPPIYTKKFESPSIEASKSFYFYFESNEPFSIKEIQFLDYYDRVP